MTKSGDMNLDHISIVLHRTRYPENIGAAARAMRNMGVNHLLLVDPQNCDLPRILRMATHAAADVVEQMEVFDSLPEALAPFQFVVGTTARLGGERQVVQTPDSLARMLGPVSEENRIALLFGPEDRGLTNEDLRFCHVLATIPTAEFASLNVAQAVLIMCYVLSTIKLERKRPFVPRLASRHELDGMYAQLKDILVRICYVNPENPDYFMNHLRHFLTRMRLRAREVSIIRGMCRQIDWYGAKCYQDGSKQKENTPCD
jgi:tRNA/rRNA methyltransferase